MTSQERQKEKQNDQDQSGIRYNRLRRKQLHGPFGGRISCEARDQALGDGRAVWDLEHDRGYDPQVLQWALRQYAAQRNERLQAESKN